MQIVQTFILVSAYGDNKTNNNAHLYPAKRQWGGSCAVHGLGTHTPGPASSRYMIDLCTAKHLSG